MKHQRLSPPQLPAVPPGTLLHPERPLLLPLPPEEPLDLEHTFTCGQVFRWRRYGDTWYGPYGAGSLAFRRAPEGIEARALDADVTAGEAWRFLGLDASLREVERRLGPDRWVREAMRAVPGMRILRQEPWDCLASYVCAQWSSIAKIELSTGRIAAAWGRRHLWPEGVEINSLPPPHRLAAAEVDDLQFSALGYRRRYLRDTARRVAVGAVDPYALRAVSYPEALRALLGLPGIGRKVADCILLFSLDKPEAFPVDVWVRRALHALYPRPLLRFLPDAPERRDLPLTPREHQAMLQFAWHRWGRLAGYAQQYLFHALRTGRLTAPAPD